MAEKTEFLPLGSDILSTGYYNTTTPISYVTNFIPGIISSDIGGKKNRRFIKRQGFRSSITTAQTNYRISKIMQWIGVPGSGTSPNTSRGVLVYTQERLSTDLRLYKYDTSETLIGTFATADYQCIGIQETLISGVANLTLAVRKTSASYDQKLLFFPNGGALTEVVDADFPASTFIGNPVHMDGYCFVATTTGNVWNSDVNSLSAWTATSFIAAQNIPDSLVGLARIRNIIVALGTRSIEFFQNVGAASGSPLQRIDNAAIQIGVLHQLACINMGDDLLFVSVSSEGVGVHLLSGGQTKKVSTVFIDLILSEYANNAWNTPLRGGLMVAGTSDHEVLFVGLLDLNGVNFAVLNIGAYQFAYSREYNLWIRLSVATSLFPTFCALGGQQVVAERFFSGTSGIVYYDNASLNPTGSGNDPSLELTAIISTSPLTMGTERIKFWNSIRIIGDYQAVSTPIIVKYSDDNGANFTTWGTIDMGVSPPVVLTRGGASRKRIFSFTNTSGNGCAIDAVAVTFIVGTS